MDKSFGHHRLAASLAGQGIGHTVVYHAETGSTNDEARALAEAGHPHGVTVVADHQTAGRGRRGAAWFSPPRKNLLLSVILRPPWPPAEWPRLTHVAALAVCDGIEAVMPDLHPQVKWPNDIFLSGRKTAGLLLESSFPAQGTPFAVLGLGLNVNLATRDLPADLRATTTSLALESNQPHLSREPLAAAVLRSLNRLLSQPTQDFPHLLDSLHQRSTLIGQRIRASAAGRDLVGVATSFGPDGQLILRLDDGSPIELNAADSVRRLD